MDRIWSQFVDAKWKRTSTGERRLLREGRQGARDRRPATRRRGRRAGCSESMCRPGGRSASRAKRARRTRGGAWGSWCVGLRLMLGIKVHCLCRRNKCGAVWISRVTVKRLPATTGEVVGEGVVRRRSGPERQDLGGGQEVQELGFHGLGFSFARGFPFSLRGESLETGYSLKRTHSQNESRGTVHGGRPD